MYDIRPNLLIGFHGCDLSVRKDLINKPDTIVISEKPHDWLGHGMYFWENNSKRAFQWAKEKASRGEIETPTIVGAVLVLGRCLDLLDSEFIHMLQTYGQLMKTEYDSLNKFMPENKDIRRVQNKDKVLRALDCALIEYTHEKIEEQILLDEKNKGFSDFQMFDSTRGVFIEGEPVLAGAEIYDKTHIQICIRNPNCIKGFFIPREETEFIPKFKK